MVHELKQRGQISNLTSDYFLQDLMTQHHFVWFLLLFKLQRILIFFEERKLLLNIAYNIVCKCMDHLLLLFCEMDMGVNGS